MSHADEGISLTELRHVVRDLQELVGLPLVQAWVPNPTSVVLNIGRCILLVSSWPLPRVHPVRRRPPGPRTPYSFQGLLRARLHGALDGLRVVGEDRILEVQVGRYVVHARLFGRGGIWLLEDGRVVARSDGPAPPTLPPAPAVPERTQRARFAADGERGWAEAATEFFEATHQRRQEAELRRRLVSHLGTLRRRDERLRANLKIDLDRSERVEDLRHRADCLAARLHAIPRGCSEIEIPDVSSPGDTVTVSLHPARSPAENLIRLYEKARRLERAGEHVLHRLSEVEKRLETLAEDTVRLATTSLPALEQLALVHQLPSPQPHRQTPVSTPWATWHGPRGERLLVGRSDVANHALVFRHARGRDWWVHVRERPGAHVVLPTERGATPPLDLLLAAAQLVLRVSRVPAGDTLDVQYARVADLRPIKGAGPGRVIVTNERVLHVTSEPEALSGWFRED